MDTPEASSNSTLQQTPSQVNFMRPPSKYINNYVINYEFPIGQGNFSTVYPASDLNQPNAKYAVKLINVANLREHKIDYLAKMEMQMLKAVNHRNIISCKDVFSDELWSYLITDYYQGGNLESIIKKLKDVPQTEMLTIIKDIFQGLRYLQKCKIIHRDVKAANIFISQGRAVVADLGFAKFFYQPFYDLHIGSLPYMPPQTLSKGLYSNKTDVWAFGILLYQIFHGQSPYAKCTDLNDLIKNTSIPFSIINLRLDLSVQMKQMILSCLEIDMGKRPKFSEIEQTWYFKKLFNPAGYSSAIVPKDNLFASATDITPNIFPNLLINRPEYIDSSNETSIKNDSSTTTKILAPPNKSYRAQPKIIKEHKWLYFSEPEIKSSTFSKVRKLKQDLKRKTQQKTASPQFQNHQIQNETQSHCKQQKMALSCHNSISTLSFPSNNSVQEEIVDKISYAFKIPQQQTYLKLQNRSQSLEDILKRINKIQKNIRERRDMITKYNIKSNPQQAQSQVGLMGSKQNKQKNIRQEVISNNNNYKFQYQFKILK